MRLSLDGHSLGGSTRVLRDGVPLDLGGVTAGNPVWSNRRPLFQFGSDAGGWRLGTPGTPGHEPIAVDAQGQVHLFGSAGADFWAAQLTGYRDSRGEVHPTWAVVAVDDISPRAAVVVLGGLAVWDGVNLTSVEPSGADVWEPGDIHFSRGVLGYRKGGRLVTWGRPSPVHVPGQGVRFDGDYVLAWQQGRGLVLHTWDSTLGIVIATGDNFNPDIRDLGDGHVVVVAGVNQADEGEHRYDINARLRTVNGVLVDLIDLAAPVVVVPPAPPPVVPPVPPPVHPPSGGPVDLRDMTIINTAAEIASWPITTTITHLDWRPGTHDEGIHVEFDKAGTWPDVTPAGWSGPLEYTLGACVQIGGKWYASAVIQFWRGLERAGSEPSRFATNWFYASRWGVMQYYQPQPGEMIGFFVAAGNLRDGAMDVIVRERSNVVFIPFPSAAGGSWDFGAQPPIVVPPVTPPVTPPVVPPVHPPVVTPPLDYTAFLEACIKLDDKWKATHHGELPDGRQRGHLVWRLLVEGYSLEQLLSQIVP
jgi:hypothetical protein